MALSKRKTKRDVFSAGRKNRKASHVLLFALSCFFSALYLGWRALFTLPFRYGIIATILGVLLFISELMASLESLIQFRQINKRMVPEMPDIPDDWFPDVDILIATHNESTQLLYKTINACNYLRYPDKSKIHVYLCDDNNRPEMAALAAKLNIGYFGLSGNKHAKAGNLNNALRQTHSPLVATFDSDMIPTSDFLLKTVPYFFIPMLKKDKATGHWIPRSKEETDPSFKIGFIQTPQSFYNPDLFQFNLFSETRIPNEQDYFFREVNVGRNADNGVIYAGSNTVLSREALKSVNYIAEGCITEDFMTGLRMQKKGYTAYAVPDELAHGLAPNTVSSLLKQRERWGRGCIQALRQENILLTPHLPLWTKISYLAAWSYWWTFARRLIYILAPIVTILFNMPVMDVTAWEVFVFWIPHYVFINSALKYISKGIRNRHWSNVYDTIMFPYLFIPILLETIGIKKQKFVVTNKERKRPKRDLSLLFMLPYIELLIANVLSLIICARFSFVTHSIYSPFIFFWLCMNTKDIIFAIFFMYGRENYRMAERSYVNLPVRIDYGGVVFEARTNDISETGLAILINEPVYFPPNPKVPVHIVYREYEADMKVEIVHISKIMDAWKYSMRIVDISDENFNQYLQIVYDRSHTMPRHLDASLGILDDIKINLTNKRSQSNVSGQLQQSRYKWRSSVRQPLPHIELGAEYTLANGIQCVILDFNYEYIILKHTALHLRPHEMEKCLRLDVEPGVILYLEYVPNKYENDYGLLYRVANSGEFVCNLGG